MNQEKFLQNIIQDKKRLLKGKKAFFNMLIEQLSRNTYSRYELFKTRISAEGRMNLIAEIKKASPSIGMIREDFDLLAIARTYAKNGAAAISILTEEKYFLGKPEYVKKTSDEINLPILAKDFFIDEGQIYEARFNGASAILLITGILNDKQLKGLMKVAHYLDLDCLVEIHDEEELDRALCADADIIGVNNRNLKTFEVDLSICEGLIPKIPAGKIIVAESGIKTNQDINRLQALGAHAVLIGETFMREDDIGKKIKEVMG